MDFVAVSIPLKLKDAVDIATRKVVIQSMKSSKTVTEAAGKLGISRVMLYRYLKTYRLKPKGLLETEPQQKVRLPWFF